MSWRLLAAEKTTVSALSSHSAATLVDGSSLGPSVTTSSSNVGFARSSPGSRPGGRRSGPSCAQADTDTHVVAAVTRQTHNRRTSCEGPTRNEPFRVAVLKQRLLSIRGRALVKLPSHVDNAWRLFIDEVCGVDAVSPQQIVDDHVREELARDTLIVGQRQVSVTSLRQEVDRAECVAARVPGDRGPVHQLHGADTAPGGT